MRKAILTPEQINKAKELRQRGKTKRELARLFNVGETTIWENVFTTQKRTRIFIRKEPTTYPTCETCEIRLKEEIEINDDKRKIPHNFKLGNKCISCVLSERSLTWEDLQDFNILIHTK